jgi:hypothetical protein
MIQRLVCSALLLAAAGCEKSTTPTTPPPGDTAGAVGADDGAADAGAADGGQDVEDMAWHDMDFDQRKEFMGTVVYPKMKTAFQGYDAGTYAKFTCDTCHGEDAKEKKFAMPSDSIYPLPKEGYIEAAKGYDEKVTQFMIDVVVPQMAEMVGEEPDTTGSGTGFGCLECHPTE